MRDRRLILMIGIICLATCWMFLGLGSERPVHAQQPVPAAPSGATPPAATTSSAATQASDTTVFRAETRLVLVDAVVTDKKGNYIRDLSQKDFKVWEDGKEQAITNFSFEENTGSSNPQTRYMVLFFDNSTMDFGDQAKARDAAAKFIDANAGPGRLIAIADFGGTVKISQNFTADAQRLKQVVKGIKTSSVSPDAAPVTTVASLGAPTLPVPALGNAEADFGIHSVLLALRSLGKDLSTVPGRKTLVMLTSGFPLSPEYQSEVTAVIDTCNKSNVAIYPIDVRGLTVPDLPGMQNRLTQPSVHSPAGSIFQAAFHFSGGKPMLRLAAFAEPADPLPAQHGGGGGGGTGGGGGGGHGGGGSGGGGARGGGGGRGRGR